MTTEGDQRHARRRLARCIVRLALAPAASVRGRAVVTRCRGRARRGAGKGGEVGDRREREEGVEERLHVAVPEGPRELAAAGLRDGARPEEIRRCREVRL